MSLRLEKSHLDCDIEFVPSFEDPRRRRIEYRGHSPAEMARWQDEMNLHGKPGLEGIRQRVVGLFQESRAALLRFSTRPSVGSGLGTGQLSLLTRR